MFGVLPASLLKLPQSEFRILRRYYLQVREQMESPSIVSDEPTDGTILE